MEKRSIHYGDVAKWIEKVIDSCETHNQLITARNLVSNFRKRLSSDNFFHSKYYYSVIVPLDDRISYKRDNLRVERLTNQ
jgi:hypothetical protein